VQNEKEEKGVWRKGSDWKSKQQYQTDENLISELKQHLRGVCPVNLQWEGEKKTSVKIRKNLHFN